MKKYIVILFALVISAVYLLGCENFNRKNNPLGPGNQSELGKTAPMKINIDFAPLANKTTNETAAKIAAIESIDRATVYVYDSPWLTFGTPIVEQNLLISNANVANGTINVPIADEEESRNVDIHIVFYGEDDPQNPIVRYYGEKTMELVVDQMNTINIIVVFMGVDTQIKVSETLVDHWECNVKTSIHICWDEVTSGFSNLVSAYSWTYLLQESFNDANFSNPTTIYTGSDMEYMRSKQGQQVGQYTYRTRVNTTYGYGPWYSAGVATVDVKPKKSKIDFEFVLPSDEPL